MNYEWVYVGVEHRSPSEAEGGNAKCKMQNVK
jgi:hypothetical protein